MTFYSFLNRKAELKVKDFIKFLSANKFWIVISGLFVLAPCFISYFGLFGDWRTYVFGVTCQNIWEPSSAYWLLEFRFLMKDMYLGLDILACS